MSNDRKQTAVEWLEIVLIPDPISEEDFEHNINCWKQAKEMQQEQAQLYATFVLMCVNNNLPPITFNDWIENIWR
jgi:hypothetical protein